MSKSLRRLCLFGAVLLLLAPSLTADSPEVEGPIFAPSSAMIPNHAGMPPCWPGPGSCGAFSDYCRDRGGEDEI